MAHWSAFILSTSVSVLWTLGLTRCLASPGEVSHRSSGSKVLALLVPRCLHGRQTLEHISVQEVGVKLVV